MNFPPPEIIKLFKETNGAISVHEACAIYWLAGMCPDGAAIELGSHLGKAAIAAAAGLPNSKHTYGRIFYLVDPAYDLDNRDAWANSVQRTPDNAHHYFRNEGFCNSVKDRIWKASASVEMPECHSVLAHLMGDYSLHAIPEIPVPFAYCFVDSDIHSYELTRDENALLKDRMAIGGIIVYHDFCSQFHGVEQAYREMLSGGMYEEIGIPWDEIKAFVATIGGEAGNVSWHHCDNPAPCYVGALRRIL